MFGRSRRTGVGGAPPVLPNTHIEGVVVADPDTLGTGKQRALNNQYGRALQGRAGTAIDYDRGDPEHSFERVLPGAGVPANPYASLGMADQVSLPQTQVYDMATTDAELSAYQVSMLARIAR